ncbi:MAG: hypothetical protein OXD40_05215 [bacterium]|nr:hypothetical protein [bacterium]
MKRLLNWLVRPLDLQVVEAHHAQLVYFHDYRGGYKQYREVQLKHNRRKINNVWADEFTLKAIEDDLRSRGLGRAGICHGARNGFEVAWFREHLLGDVIGTDVAETATQFPHMHVWDFHDDNPEWIGKFDFIYSNSLDQALSPAGALSAWARQLVPEGRMYIEHTMAHSVEGAGEMDPFGAHPMVMPYLFFVWGRKGGGYHLDAILEVDAKQNNGMQAWIFVLALDAHSA